MTTALRALTLPDDRTDGIAADLFGPALTWTEFVDEHLGRQPLLLRGGAGRWRALFRWSDLNEVLTAHRLDVTRLHVVRDAQSTVLAHAEPVPQLGSRGRPLRLVSERLNQALADGSTLVIDAYHELHPPARAWLRDLETHVRAFVQANLYVTTTPGGEAFGAHWDDHDVFVLQAAGDKRWTLHPPTGPSPFGGETVPKPAGTPHWEGLLHDGDLLYVPRGWWHEVRAVDGPTAHLTFGARLPTGYDLMMSALRDARPQTALRGDLPHPHATGDRAAWFEALRGTVRDLLDRPGWLETVADEAYRAPAARPPFTLPDVQAGVQIDGAS